VTLTIVPFPVDLAESLALAETALRSRLAPGERLDDFWPQISSGIRTGRVSGGLLRNEHVTIGVATWDPAGPFGVSVRLLYLTPEHATPDAYRAALDTVARVAGPIAFTTGQLSGLRETDEGVILRERGFAPFGRSEMALPPTAPVPSEDVPAGVTVRPVEPSDEPALARLHERAYRNHIDRFISIEDLDPIRDADLQLRQYFAGRFGQVLSPGSTVVLLDQEIAAAVIATRRPPQALIIDVMSDPDCQGRGFARIALSESIRQLRAIGETTVVLNVTEGNDRAYRLYSGLGFVRTMGPTKEWYDARRMPVEQPSALARYAVSDAGVSGGR
jgi:ribosomal protein S18 acetylase RimI-like enzyme